MKKLLPPDHEEVEEARRIINDALDNASERVIRFNVVDTYKFGRDHYKVREIHVEVLEIKK